MTWPGLIKDFPGIRHLLSNNHKLKEIVLNCIYYIKDDLKSIFRHNILEAGKVALQGQMIKGEKIDNEGYLSTLGF